MNFYPRLIHHAVRTCSVNNTILSVRTYSDFLHQASLFRQCVCVCHRDRVVVWVFNTSVDKSTVNSQRSPLLMFTFTVLRLPCVYLTTYTIVFGCIHGFVLSARCTCRALIHLHDFSGQFVLFLFLFTSTKIISLHAANLLLTVNVVNFQNGIRQVSSEFYPFTPKRLGSN